MTDRELQVEELYRQGLALHQQRKLMEAQALYEQVLQVCPQHASALHLLGVIAHENGDSAQALDLIGRAIARDGGNALAYANRALASQALGRVHDALQDYERAIGLRPDYADAWHHRGVALTRSADCSKRWRAMSAQLHSGQPMPRHGAIAASCCTRWIETCRPWTALTAQWS